jgi:membrane protein YdbS with pleckstrin-like domain
MATEMTFMSMITPKLISYVKWGVVFLGIIIITVALVLIILYYKRRKWKIEIHEMKSDGKLHTVDRDVLEERKIESGRKTIYWLRKAKSEAIPPPEETVDRFRGKEEVDYLRIARDYIPTKKRMSVNYNDPAIKARVVSVYDRICYQIRQVKTTYFTSEPVRNKYIYIPCNKTLSANMVFEPIDYDVSMMAMNEIHNADDFYESKYEFWKKYGAVIVFAVTIVFLIILIVLTYEYMGKTIATIMGKVSETNNILTGLVDKISGGKPPG